MKASYVRKAVENCQRQINLLSDHRVVVTTKNGEEYSFNSECEAWVEREWIADEGMLVIMGIEDGCTSELFYIDCAEIATVITRANDD